ncbi:hypothetical protein Tneu_0580 [Pyrobaculum neutrophilum V24Sta]|uniref:Uncharacterized protein n=1 Tax=Pyrobaculum neutrophilum (strain DSM 2338 / JCM 9278 / NBRC 100436 / V24Sta) TaxID=444157 RepID=B1YCK9_PYRNV|nr:hypothetical protein Tneu_0580 [Pyrobaculum neutrophilum V24Sta]
MEEVRLYARRAALEEASLNPEDFWKCVGDAAELFSERGSEYCLDIGGGVRALSLCLYTAALLAVRLWNTKIEAVYTMAEHAERIVQIDLMPILYVNELTRSNANARRRILEELAEGPLEDLGRYDKKILKEFTKHGLLNNDKLTEAGKTLLKYIQRRT